MFLLRNFVINTLRKYYFLIKLLIDKCLIKKEKKIYINNMKIN
ncbi:hypothetical protein SMITH_231 [Smithella sp. ME-1]|nr:hypothetical protein SMITH_231 [Smithella sp. ME-1]